MEGIPAGEPVGSQSCQPGDNNVVATGPAGVCQIVIRTTELVADCRLNGKDVANVARAIMAAYPAGVYTGGDAASGSFIVDVHKNPNWGEASTLVGQSVKPFTSSY